MSYADIKRKHDRSRLTEQEVAALPLDLELTTGALARQMIKDHGVERAAEALERAYPAHGAKFVRKLAETAVA